MEDKKPESAATSDPNWMGVWTDVQKALQDTWRSMLEKTGAAFSGGAEGGGPRVESLMNNWREQYQAAMTKLSSFAGGDASRTVVERMMGSIDLYMKLLASWVEVALKMAGQPDSAKAAAFSELWLNTQQNLYSDMVKMSVMSPSLSPLGLGGQVFETYRLMLGNLYGANLPGFTIPGMNAFGAGGGSEGFYASWTKAYNDTIGKFIRIPAVGPSREPLEKFTRSVDAFFKLYGSTVDFYQKFQQPSFEALEKVAAKAAELSTGKSGTEGYREFFNLVIDAFEVRFNAFFKSPAYLHALEANLTNTLDFKMRFDELIEESLHTLPIPSRSEMDSLYKEVYHMRKQIKTLQAQVANLTEKRAFSE